MPYENEYSCPVNNKTYDKTRSGMRTHNGKAYRVLYGHIEGTDKWEIRSLRYNKNVWDESSARSHCKDHDGLKFEGLSKFEVKKSDEIKQLIYGIVLEPGIPDSYGDVETPEEIEKSAHGYLARMWESASPDATGSEHTMPIEGYPVQSFIAPSDFYYENTPRTNEYLVKKGSWVVVFHIIDKGEFNKAKDGVYTGLSLQGFGQRSKL